MVFSDQENENQSRIELFPSLGAERRRRKQWSETFSHCLLSHVLSLLFTLPCSICKDSGSRLVSSFSLPHDLKLFSKNQLKVCNLADAVVLTF